jgi:Ca-activated chloride channel family protein
MSKKNSIALQSVRITGTLNGLLLSTTLRQYYRNTGTKNQEMVYTFPLAFNAELMGMEVQIGEKRLKASVFERKVAREKYEDAVVDGDTPVLVENPLTDFTPSISATSPAVKTQLSKFDMPNCCVLNKGKSV